MYREAIAVISRSNPRHPRLLDQYRGIASCYEALRRPVDALRWLDAALELDESADEAPLYAGLLYFSAARNFLAAGRGRARAFELARAARAQFVLAKNDERVAEVEAWLDEHGSGAP